MKRYRFVALLVFAAACGTQNLKLSPVKVEPIKMTIDVNLHDANDVTDGSARQRAASP
jgi:hypothetical protein